MLTTTKLHSKVLQFMVEFPMEEWDGSAQQFFESVPVGDIIKFFKELYEIEGTRKD